MGTAAGRGRTVEVPVAAVALLGEHVTLIDLTAMQLATLPDAPAPKPVAADTTIEVGLVKPFH